MSKTVVIIDFSQIAYAAFFVHKVDEEKINFWKYSCLRSVARINKKFRPDELILATDRKSWRKTIFPYYKYKRLHTEKIVSGGDVTSLPDQVDPEKQFLYECMGDLCRDIKKNFPYHVIEADGAEGDDIMAVLADHLKQNHEVIVASGDKDLVQVADDHVLVYSPFKDKMVDLTEEEQSQQFLELVIKGDPTDSVPGIFSRDISVLQQYSEEFIEFMMRNDDFKKFLNS